MKFLKILLIPLKVLALVVTAYMGYIQIPELLYDFGESKPLVIESPADLAELKIRSARFVSVAGKGKFDKAFTYKRYGLDMHYFTLAPYGNKVVVRTYDKLTDEWRQMDRFIGRMRPFDKQPFSRYVEEIFEEKMGQPIPSGAYFLALGDVPKPSGWQIGGAVLAVLIWLGLFYLFFLHKRLWRKGHAKPQ